MRRWPSSFTEVASAAPFSGMQACPARQREAVCLQTTRGDQQVQRAFGTAAGDVHGEGLLATAEGAEVRHRPVQANEPQQALHEPASPWSLGPVAFPWLDLRQRHAEQHFHRQAGLDGVCRENSPPDCFLILLTAADHACRWARPPQVISGSTQPIGDCLAIACRPTARQRAPPLARLGAGGPVHCLVDRGVRSAYALQPSRWIHKVNPFTPFGQQSPPARVWKPRCTAMCCSTTSSCRSQHWAAKRPCRP